MGRRKRGVAPAYREHKPSRLAYTEYFGKRHYLGRHGTAESRAEHRRHVRLWEASQVRYDASGRVRPRSGLLCAELAEAFLTHARGRYSHADGRPTSEYEGYCTDLRPLVHGQYAGLAADDFGRDQLRELRDGWKASGITRGTVNKRLSRYKRLWRWAAAEGLIQPEVITGVLAVRGLAAGEAPDREPVGPVPPGALYPVLRRLPPALRGAAMFARRVGCRPGEALNARRGEIDLEGVARLGKRVVKVGAGLWTFTPARHKNRKRGKGLVYLVGPKAQRPLCRLGGIAGLPPDALLFPSPRGTAHGENYFAAAVRRACDAAGVARWTPNMLRHSAATEYDREFGIQTTSRILGHAGVAVTSIYAEAGFKDAAEAVRRRG